MPDRPGGVGVDAPDFLATLDTKDGMAALRKGWPDIVNAFLYWPARSGHDG